MILHPLKEGYKTLRVSVTDLEKFTQCALKYKEVPFIRSKEMEFGSKAHEMLQHFMYNRSDSHYNKIYEIYVESEKNERHRKLLSEYLDLAMDLPEQLIGEKKFEYSIEAGLYKVVLVGKLDCVDMEYGLADYKTTKSRRKEGAEEDYDRWQPYIYTRMFWKMRGVNEGIKKFYYHIFSKHKKKDAWLDTRTVEVDIKNAEEKIKGLLKKFIVAKHKDEWKPSRNLYCKGCDLYKKSICPLHFNVPNEESTTCGED